MIGESLLGLLAVLACTAGFGSSTAWHHHYESFHSAKGLPQKLAGFIDGSTTFLTGLGLPEELCGAVIAMIVVSFALTTLDSATRLLRFNIEELLASLVPFKIDMYQRVRLLVRSHSLRFLKWGKPHSHFGDFLAQRISCSLGSL